MTSLNPWAIALLVASCVIVLVSTRQNAVRAVMVTGLFIPLGQMFMVLGLHVRFVPILILFGLIRTVARGELGRIHPTIIDKLFVATAVVALVCTCFRGASPETFGSFFNSVGAYVLFRSLICEDEDLISALRMLALVGFGMGSLMLVEHFTGQNPFHVFGGVQLFDDVRDGRPRCQGPFRHSLMAGAFGATLLPLMFGLWNQDSSQRRRAMIGMIGSLVITVTAVSSGALLTFFTGLAGIFLWKYRERMSFFRRGVVIAIVLLQLVMNAPFWYIIARISDIMGGSGWHRSFLIDQFIHHFDEWWLIGTSYTAHWGPGGQVIIGNTNMMDITNNYVAQGIMGGLLGLILFVWMLVSCFKTVGRLVRAGGCGKLPPKLLWMLGVTTGAHAMAFISVWYFDQITIYWTWLVATISSLVGIAAALPPQSVEDEIPDVPEEQGKIEEPDAYASLFVRPGDRPGFNCQSL